MTYYGWITPAPQQKRILYYTINDTNVEDYFANYTNSTNSSDWWASFFNQSSFNQDVSDLDSNLHPASDVDINGVLTAIVFGSVVFVIFILSYEVLRRCFPNVYASKQSREIRLERARQKEEREKLASSQSSQSSQSPEQWEDNDSHSNASNISETGSAAKDMPFQDSKMSEGDVILNNIKKRRQKYAKTNNLPDVYKSEIPLQWIKPVFDIPWRQVRESCGLDAYFFLRYIRMCLKITSVSALWGMIILFPVYAYGDNGACGWYHVSMANVSQGSRIIWVSVFFIYFFSFFVLFVIKQEYKHFVQLRLDFLGKGDGSTDLQHHYSLMIENIPEELRSDSALFAYFNKLFPGKVHSANTILKLPELESLSQRKLRITRRLEKSIAYYEATGERPTHITGRFRTMVCGVESSPVEWCCDSNKVVDIDDIDFDIISKHGLRVDSIDYYTKDLQNMNIKLFQLQKKKRQFAAFGNRSLNGNGWFSVLSDYAEMFFNDEVSEGHEQNLKKDDSDDSSSVDSIVSIRLYNRKSTWKPASRRYLFQEYVDDSVRSAPSSNLDETGLHEERNEDTSQLTNRRYGSLESNAPHPSSNSLNRTGTEDQANMRNWFATKKTVSFQAHKKDISSEQSKEEPLIAQTPPSKIKTQKVDSSTTDEESKPGVGFTNMGGSERSIAVKRVSKAAVSVGFDFGVYFLKLVGRWLSTSSDDPRADVMSSTGFVTFLDLGTVTSVASTPLTHKPRTLTVEVAPEPRDIIWDNCSGLSEFNERRKYYANILLILGAVLWSVPLASIQALASAEQVAKLPGMEWISDYDEGRLKILINAYLPVITLLSIILILPLIFEAIAISYEKRKTMSDVDKSVVSRYFYYQLANIYITVTAGSIWISASQIIEHPSAGLEILGNSLPTVVGYFISLLVTKILGGLPIVILRVGALGRYLILRLLHRTKFLTQRELDNVYIVEPLYYGWEYPTQMLVIVICFTYACISPIILVFGALYFFPALMVYKKQVLYVYSCSYESGGDLFPLVCDRTIFGLICGQLTFMGYSIVRGGHFFQVLSVLPLIFFTLYTMQYFHVHFAQPSKRLTLELARELDSKIEQKSQIRSPPSNHPLFESYPDLNAIPQDFFDRNYYKQPVMTEPHGEPMFYRIDRKDPLTKLTVDKLRRSRLHMWDAGREKQQIL